MRNFCQRAALALATLGAAVSAGSIARAEVLATATRTFDINNSSGSPFVLPLNDVGNTALAFATTTPRQKIVITYNAECAAVGTAAGDWLSVTILVDGRPANPNSGTDFALCTSVVPSQQVWVGAVRQSVFTVPRAGAHNVTIVATGVGTTSWRLDDTSLVVER